MGNITSPRRIARMFRQYYKSESDQDCAITSYYGVSGMVAEMSRRALERRIFFDTPYSVSEAERIAEEWEDAHREHKLRHKNPARLAWKRKASVRRHHASMIAAQEEYYDNEVNF